MTVGNNVTTTGNLVQSAGTGTTTLNGVTAGGNVTMAKDSIMLATAPITATGGISLTAANSIGQNVNLAAGSHRL